MVAPLNKQTTLLYDSVRLLSSGKDPQEVLNALVEIVSKAGGGLCAIFVTDQNTRSLKLSAIYHENADTVNRCVRLAESSGYRVGIGVVGRAVETGREVVWHVSDGEVDPADHTYVEATDAKSVIAAPIRCGQKVVGAFTCWSVCENPPDEEDIGLVQSFADVAGAAVQNTRLWEELSLRDEWRKSLVGKLMSGQEEERAKLARQLHDDASQLLSSVLLELTRLEQESDGSVAERVTALRIETENALGRVHDIAVELRPPAIDDIGVSGALRRYVSQCAAGADLKIDFVAANIGPAELDRDAQVSLYRIAQEAILNVVSHSGAQCAGVTLERRKGWVVLTIEDDGHGFNKKKYTEDSVKRSLGIFGMRERASLLGGSIHIDSNPGVGTAVTVRIPLQEGGQG
jgi:signal transduction histidine kinase